MGQQNCAVRLVSITSSHQARMGADGDPMAALDARMRVRVIEGLRLADMSAVPDINAGNTNAPATMLGNRCAGFILGTA
ncbi:choline dehydrogenase [Sinorhizobium meliloti]|nr:choline dehydrogenase [Sinorhizobium meliloti]